MEKYYDMPKGCRYMSEDTDLLPYLRQFNKFILNKTVTGCGGTSLFLNSSIDVVIISPRLQALKVYVNIQNLKTWKHNTGYTPELGGTATAFGVDNGSYPVPAVYTFGINLTF